MAYAPTLVAKVTMDPVPRVEITFATVAATTVTATVYRSAAGRTFRVRGGVRVSAAGGFSLVDTEPPVGIVVAYRAEMFDVAGVSLGFTDQTTVTVNFIGTVLHQPLNPTRAVLVGVELGTAATIDRKAIGEYGRADGRAIPVWIGFGRGGVEATPMRFWTESAEAEAALQSIFGTVDDPQLPIACMRTSLSLGLPQPFFARMDLTRIQFDQPEGGETTRWAATADEVAPPLEMVLTALLTYGDLEATYATYSALEAAYLTYLAMESDYSLAGVV